MKQITPKQERFCQEYVVDCNGTQAAIRAGYSEKTANEQSSQHLAKLNIQKRIKKLMEQKACRTEITADKILGLIWEIASCDVAEAFDSMGQMKPLTEIPPAVRRAIGGLEVNEIFDGQGDEKHAIGLAKKVKFWSKDKALEMLGRHLRLFADKVEHSGPDGGPIEHRDLSKIPEQQLDAEIKEKLQKVKGK